MIQKLKIIWNLDEKEDFDKLGILNFPIAIWWR